MSKKDLQKGSATGIVVTIGAVIILALIGIAGYFWYESQQSTVSSAHPTSTPTTTQTVTNATNTAVPIPTAAPNQTLDTTQYQSNDLGITFAYPSSWVITTTTSEIILSNPTTYSPYVTLDESDTSFADISDAKAGKTVAYWFSTTTNQWMTTGIENYSPATYSSESKTVMNKNGQITFIPNKSLVATPESYTEGGLPVFEGVADDTVVPLSANKFLTVLNSSATQNENTDLISSIEPLSTDQ